MSTPNTKPISSVTAELKSLSARAKELRAKTESVRAKISALNDAPVSLADFAKYLKNYINVRAKVYQDSLWLTSLYQPKPGSTISLKDTPFADLERVSTLSVFRPLPEMSEVHANRGSTFDAFCFFMPEKVFEKLYPAIQNSVGESWGNTDTMPIEKRIAAIKELTAELEKVRPQLKSAESEIEEISTLIADAAK